MARRLRVLRFTAVGRAVSPRQKRRPKGASRKGVIGERSGRGFHLERAGRHGLAVQRDFDLVLARRPGIRILDLERGHRRAGGGDRLADGAHQLALAFVVAPARAQGGAVGAAVGLDAGVDRLLVGGDGVLGLADGVRSRHRITHHHLAHRKRIGVDGGGAGGGAGRGGCRAGRHGRRHGGARRCGRGGRCRGHRRRRGRGGAGRCRGVVAGVVLAASTEHQQAAGGEAAQEEGASGRIHGDLPSSAGRGVAPSVATAARNALQGSKG